MDRTNSLVCVLCGRPWEPFLNVCECGGMCTWGEEKGGPPNSWDVNQDGSWTPKEKTVTKDLADRQKIINAMYAFTEEHGRHGCPIAKLRDDTGLEEAKLRRLVMQLSGLGWLIIHPGTVDPDQIVDVVLCRNN